MTEKPNFQTNSTQTTGGDPIEGVDPGGTRSTKPGQANKAEDKAAAPASPQTNASGDRNPYRESRTAPPAKQ